MYGAMKADGLTLSIPSIFNILSSNRARFFLVEFLLLFDLSLLLFSTLIGVERNRRNKVNGSI